jgi:hypothetical protein
MVQAAFRARPSARIDDCGICRRFVELTLRFGVDAPDCSMDANAALR